MSTKSVTDASFEADVLGAGEPVLVVFWAEWCGPCRLIAPALEELAAQYEGKLTVAKINIDESPETPGRYGVRGIPTLMIFRNGELASTKVGAAPKSAIESWIKSELAKGHAVA
ncbi:MAG: thioredoxin [Parvularculaceae bacterium]